MISDENPIFAIASCQILLEESNRSTWDYTPNKEQLKGTRGAYALYPFVPRRASTAQPEEARGLFESAEALAKAGEFPLAPAVTATRRITPTPDGLLVRFLFSSKSKSLSVSKSKSMVSSSCKLTAHQLNSCFY